MIRAEVYRIRRKKSYGQKLWFLIRIFLLAFFVLALLNAVFIESITVGSNSNSPSINKGDRLFSTPLFYGVSIPFSGFRFKEITPPQRGDLVVFEMRKDPPGFPVNLFKGLLSFFSFGLLGRDRDYQGKVIDTLQVKRVIGIPGDKIYIDQFLAFIQPKDALDFIKENQLIKTDYPINIAKDYYITDWQEEFPFSGHRNTMTLNENQYFLLGDNRTASTDSLSLGPVEKNQIKSRIIFRFWPLNRIGLP